MEYKFWIPLVLSIGLAIWNFFQQLKLQELKKSGEKQLHIHKLQFDKEFQIYSEIWSSLVELRDIAVKLRPEGDILNSEHTYETMINKRLETAVEIGNSIIKMVENNKPFYSKEVYDSLQEVIKLVRSEITEVQHGDKQSIEYWEKGINNIPKLLHSTEIVCKNIRNRIGIIE